MKNESERSFVCIYRIPSHDQLVLIKSLLEANKIPHFIENEHFASLSGIADGAINFGIMIEVSHAEEAKEFLSEIIQPKPKEP